MGKRLCRVTQVSLYLWKEAEETFWSSTELLSNLWRLFIISSCGWLMHYWIPAQTSSNQVDNIRTISSVTSLSTIHLILKKKNLKKYQNKMFSINFKKSETHSALTACHTYSCNRIMTRVRNWQFFHMSLEFHSSFITWKCRDLFSSSFPHIFYFCQSQLECVFWVDLNLSWTENRIEQASHCKAVDTSESNEVLAQPGLLGFSREVFAQQVAGVEAACMRENIQKTARACCSGIPAEAASRIDK